MPKDYEAIIYERNGHIATMTMNRPESLNAWTAKMEEEMFEVFREVNADPGIRAFIITGKGRGFCAGEDATILKGATERKRGPELESNNTTQVDTPRAASSQTRYLMRTVEKPVIAAINGVVAGGGYGFALAADIRVASENAVFHSVYIRRGLVISCEHWFLPRYIGLGPALYKMLTAGQIDAEEAYRLNLVQSVVPQEKLMEEANMVAERISELPPITMKFSKRAIWKALDSDLEQAMEYVGYSRSAMAHTNEMREGVMSFIEKRKPKW